MLNCLSRIRAKYFNVISVSRRSLFYIINQEDFVKNESHKNYVTICDLYRIKFQVEFCWKDEIPHSDPSFTPRWVQFFPSIDSSKNCSIILLQCDVCFEEQQRSPLCVLVFKCDNGKIIFRHLSSNVLFYHLSNNVLFYHLSNNGCLFFESRWFALQFGLCNKDTVKLFN